MWNRQCLILLLLLLSSLFVLGCYKGEEIELAKAKARGAFAVEERSCERDAKALGFSKWYLSTRAPNAFLYFSDCFVIDNHGTVVKLW